MKKTKVVRIIDRLNIGGPSIHTILLAKTFNNDRYETILVTGRESEYEGNMFDLAAEKGVKPLIIPELGREIRWFNDLIALFKLYRLLRQEKPDIVHTHKAKAGALGRVAAILYRLSTLFLYPSSSPTLSIIHTFHGHVLSGYFGKLKTRCFIYIEKLLAFFSTNIVAVSEGVKRDLLSFGIGDPEKIITIPLGLELAKFQEVKGKLGQIKREFGISEDVRLVGIVGRLARIKGHHFFLKAAKKVIENLRVGERPVKFLIVGDGELRQELMQLTLELEIQDAVIFTGFRRDLDAIYADLDLVVSSSLNEGTPVALIEAMASEKPVVATDVGGTRDLFDLLQPQERAENGLTFAQQGVLVPACKPEILAQAVLSLLRDEKLRREMGEYGRGSVISKYDVENLAKQIDLLYSRLSMNHRHVGS
ncbi:MAG: glycosyltransferase [Candidatus Tectomicrobia bacterium]|nr:glycosyltransferase [Candidatus Tectomicrobia bacterium]